jgi:hypothetical protein
VIADFGTLRGDFRRMPGRIRRGHALPWGVVTRRGVVTDQGQTPDKPADLDTPDGPNRKVLQDGVQTDRKRPADPEQLRFLASLTCSPVRV